MAVLVYILGYSGTGKSYSMRNFDPKDLAVINVQGKPLPFKGAGKYTIENTDCSDLIVKRLKEYSKEYKSIVVDDFQYLMANEFMRRSTERGYDKFTDIARHAWDIADTVSKLPADVIVYIMCHLDTDGNTGAEKIKTIGKLLDEKICLEGMSTIVLKTNVTDGQYYFITQNNGKDTTKSPAGMFPAYAIDNDLHYVDQKIRSWYEFDGGLTEEDMKEVDEAVKTMDTPLDTGRRGRRGRTAETADATPTPAAETPTPAAETPEKPQPSRQRKSREQVQAENEKVLANAGMEEAGDKEEVPYEDVKEPELQKLPRRSRRTEEPAEEPAPAPAEESTPATRRRRTRG